MIRTHAITTPKPCQDRKVAAIRDACNRRELRVTLFKGARVTMPGFGEILQKAVYLGVGLASYAGEKASSTLGQLRSEAQKLADELVKRGEMTTDEARKFVEDMMAQAQQPPVKPAPEEKPKEPRRIQIVSDEDDAESEGVEDVEKMRQRVQSLQEELRRLKDD